MVYCNTKDQFVLMPGGERHTLEQRVKAEADHDPHREHSGGLVGVVHMAMLNAVRKLLKHKLKYEPEKDKKADGFTGSAVRMVDMGNQVQHRDGK